MFRNIVSFVAVLAIVLFVVACDNSPTATDVSEETGTTEMAQAAAKTASGFDEFGYNYKARIFVGPSDGYDRVLGNDPTYGQDHLVMKWSKAWDDARFNGAPWTPAAWENNEWNGKVPGGSGEIWHYKIVWVGPELENSQYWREGGYAVWGQFEVILSQGSVDSEHIWETHANPSGYGTPK